MAYTYVWPPGLPQRPNTDYKETGGARFLSSPMDAGPAKVRRRSSGSPHMSVTYRMTQAQFDEVFVPFVRDTIRGVLRFGLPHPRTGAMTEVRFAPTSEEKQYDLSYVGPDDYDVSFELEVLP